MCEFVCAAAVKVFPCFQANRFKNAKANKKPSNLNLLKQSYEMFSLFAAYVFFFCDGGGNDGGGGGD